MELFLNQDPFEENITKNSVYYIPCNCGKEYKHNINHFLKVRVEEHQKSIVHGETLKSGMSDHV